VADWGGSLTWNVLNQSAAHGDIEDLQPAADGKNGQTDSEGLAGEKELHGISRAVAAAGAVDSLPSVMSGIHVVAAREQKTIEVGED
jgi:hypothetical protein